MVGRLSPDVLISEPRICFVKKDFGKRARKKRFRSGLPQSASEFFGAGDMRDTHADLVDDLRTTVRALPVQRAFRPGAQPHGSRRGAQPQGSRLPLWCAAARQPPPSVIAPPPQGSNVPLTRRMFGSQRLRPGRHASQVVAASLRRRRCAMPTSPRKPGARRCGPPGSKSVVQMPRLRPTSLPPTSLPPTPI